MQMFLRQCSSSERLEIASHIDRLGGKLEGGKDGESGSLLIFAFPISVGFRTVERTMGDISERFSVDRWMYGNVYSTVDGVTPLNWWNEHA